MHHIFRIHPEAEELGEVENESPIETKTVDQNASPTENKTNKVEEDNESKDKLEGKATYNCEICSKSLSSAHGLEGHMQLVHQTKRLPCEFCGKQVIEAKFQNHLVHCEIVHYKRYSGHPFQCDKCKRSFSRKSHLSEHQNIHFKKIQEKFDAKSGHDCDICSKTLPSSLWLARHMEIVHQSQNISLEELMKLEEAKSAYDCDKCSKTLSSSHRLERHMEIVHQSQRLSCEFCGKQVIEAMFQKHLVICQIVHYKKFSGHPFQCQKCKRSFKSNIELTRHQNVHSRLRFNCEFCKQRFSTNSNKKVHVSKFHANIRGNEVPKVTLKRMSTETFEKWKKKTFIIPRIT